MKYTKPNFNHEWDEATRYPEFEEMGKEGWIKLASSDFDIKSFSKIKETLGNVDLDFDNLDEKKKKRFERAFNDGVIEIPMAVKFGENDYDLIAGNTRIAGLVKNKIDPKIWIIDMTKKELEEAVKSSKMKGENPCWDGYKMVGKKKKNGKEVPNCVAKEGEVKEMDSGDSGAFEGPLGGSKEKTPVIKRPIGSIPNFLNEDGIMGTGEYDVPFGGGGPKGRKNPLKIDGVKSIAKAKAVKDKKFPKWGGPGSIFIKIKDKCKKFPYCNQGIDAIEILHEIEGLQDAITETSKKYGIPHKEVEKIVLNEINKIFI
jgi:hypothetical protein